MTIFEVDKDALRKLSGEQLEELVARLAEAEVASAGQSPGAVSWSGSINAPDSGIDIRVNVQAPGFSTGFLCRSNTIFQVKKPSMPANKIREEMRRGDALAPAISRQAEARGAYIIVSLADNCTEPEKEKRLKAMREAMAGDPNQNAIHLDFYDRSRLHLWLRQHPAVVLWVRGVLGQPLSGWRPYEQWSNPPAGADDTLILASGVSVVLPTGRPRKLSLADAIEPARDLIRSTCKAIRITGLSGVGKTRIVQALFDEAVGTKPLDRTLAVYADAGAGLDPSAHAMLERLIAGNHNAFLVLDNCPPDLHSDLAMRVTSAGPGIRLMTVEYDIRDDTPQATDVIRIATDGPEIAEELVLRRFPKIGQANARRVAKFADGNTRVSLAVAERVEEGESLAHLSDAELFDRLFHQRNQDDGQLRAHAEALSLVYSFSVSSDEGGIDELAVLGSIYDVPGNELYRSVSTLLERHVAQERGQWRAILPHAIANRLTGGALKRVRMETLRSVLETPGHERLLLSFAHRLGLMHEHPVAQEIVRAWLREDGPLRTISGLDSNGVRMLDYVAPVVPDAVLDRIAAEIASLEFSETEALHTSRRRTVLNILAAIAYDREYFDRCVALLLKMTDFKDESNDDHAARDARYKIVNFFQACFSGTHASLRQREAVLLDALRSENPARQELGLRMLCTALGGPPWTGTGMTDFGARPRDFGLEPDSEQLAEWHGRFIGIAVETGLGTDHGLAKQARSVLAQRFQGLWEQAEVRSKLVEAAGDLNARQPWLEGWREVRATIAFYYRKKTSDDAVEPIPPELAELEANLAPADLPSKIEAYVFGRGHDPWFLDDEFDGNEADKYGESILSLEEKAKQLGEAFALSGQEIASLGAGLFSADSMRCRAVFGRGLAVGSLDKPAMWEELVSALKKHGSNDFDSSILRGFVEQIDIADRALAQKFLDRCRDEPLLRRVLVELHPPGSFDENDLDRCLAVFELPEVGARMYGKLLWQDCFAALPHRKLVKLAERMPAKPDGADTLLEALLMKLHQTDSSVDTLGADFRRAGLIAATNRLLKNREDPGGDIDHLTGHSMKQVVGSALSFDGNDEQKTAWLDAIFVGVDRYGYFHAFDAAVRMTASRMPAAFLDKVFACDEEIRQKRRLFIEHGGDGDRLPLSDVDVSVLIGWCKQRNDPEAWAIVAAGVDQWDLHEETIVLSKAAIRLLEAAPDAEVVLRACAGKIEQRLPSVNRVGVMERRAEAFKNLFDHPNESISVAARRVYQEVPPLIARKKESEKCMERMNRDREQRFE